MKSLEKPLSLKDASILHPPEKTPRPFASELLAFDVLESRKWHSKIDIRRGGIQKSVILYSDVAFIFRL